MTWVWFILKLVLLGGLGYATLCWLANRIGGNRLLRRLLGASYGVRVVLAVSLFAISYWRLPILKSLQFNPGYWIFGLDCQVYDAYGSLIVKAWEQGIDFPDPGLGLEYFAVVAALYKIVGTHPLFPILFNCWLGAVNGVLAFVLGRRLANERVGFSAAALVSLWPSSLLWSAQLLKDALSWFLVLATLVAVQRALPAGTEQPTRPPLFRRALRALVTWGGLSLGVLMLTRLRTYLGTSLTVGALIIFVPAMGLALARKRVDRAIRYASLTFVMVFSLLIARTINLRAWLSPHHPELGYARIAAEYWRQGDLTNASGMYEKSIQANSQYPFAYLGYATVMTELDKKEIALKYYAKYLTLDGNPQTILLINRIRAQLFVSIGNEALRSGEWDEAGYAYALALALNPAEVPPHAARWIALPRGEGVFTVDSKLVGVAYLEMGDYYLQQGDFIGSMSGYLEARSIYAGAAIQSFISKRVDRLKRLISDSGGRQPAPPSIDTEHDVSDGHFIQLPTHTVTDATLLAHKVFLTEVEASPLQMLPPTSRRRRRLLDQLAGIDEAALATAHEATPESMGSLRNGFLQAGGYSLIDAQFTFSSLPHQLRYLPRALVVGFLSPFPSQWFDTKGSTGIMRSFSSIEMLLIYFLIPAIIMGVGRLFRERRPGGMFLLAFVVLLAVSMSLVVANLGTLFRLRLQFFLPLAVVAAIGQPLLSYRNIVTCLVTRVRAMWGSMGIIARPSRPAR